MVVLSSIAKAGWIPTPINKTIIPKTNAILRDSLVVRIPPKMEIFLTIQKTMPCLVYFE